MMARFTKDERERLEELRDAIAAGQRFPVALDGPDVGELAFSRLLQTEAPSCNCGRSDGEGECHCRSP